MRFLCFDTEDNSAELVEKGLNTRHKKVTQIAAIDSEGGTYYNKGNVPEFIKYLRQRKEKFVYAHNLSYDLGNLFAEELDSLNWTLAGSRLLRAEWHQTTFRDTLNMFPMALKKLGKSVGLEKLDFNAHDKRYVFRDVEIMVKALSELLAVVGSYGLDTLPGTIGGLAVRLWKAQGGENWFADDQIYREGFYGGRVECFRQSGNGVSYVDFNSLYPWAMTQPFPIEAVQQRTLDCWGMAEVTIRVPEMFVAPLPLRDAEDRIVYPIGRLRGVWTAHEIRHAEALGCKVEKVHWIFGSKKAERYYAAFVHHFYERRLRADSEARKLFFKLLMNNLYGQLATSGVITRTMEAARIICGGQMFGAKILRESMIPLPDHTNVLHAAYVTSYARIKLGNAMRQLPEKSLIYCDTDSILYEGKNLLPISDGLGELKLVASGKSCAVYGPKCYVYGKEAKAKGVPQRLALEFIKHRLATWYQPNKLRRAINSFDAGNLHKLAVWEKVHKERLAEYDRKTLKNGRYYPCLFGAKV